jgi:VanZ family protein
MINFFQLRREKSATWIAIAWLVTTTVLLSIPGSALPKQNWFDKIWLDKWFHVVLFGITVLLWCRAIMASENKRAKVFAQITFYVFLYGVVMEFIQEYLIPNRSFDVGDIIADLIGSLAGFLFTMQVYKKNRPL